MKYCTACGKEGKGDHEFCTSCGAKMPSDWEEKQEKKPIPKKRKIIFSLLAVIVISLLGTHLWLSNYYNPLKDLAAMDEAVFTNDMNKFLNHIEFADDAILQRKSYFEYIANEEWNETLKNQYLSIIEESKRFQTPLDNEIVGTSGHPLFKVKQQSFILGLYQTFTLHAIPTKLVANSNLDNVKITIGEKEITLKDAEKMNEMGRAYQGEYEVEAKAEGKYGNFKETFTFDVPAGDKMEMELFFDFKEFYIASNYDYGDASVYVDGKDTKKKLDEGFSIGPFPKKSNAKLHAEWKDEKGNIVRSNTVKVDDIDSYTDIYFDFDETKTIHKDVAQEAEVEAGQFILEFREAYEDAVNYIDYTEIAPFIKSDSHADKELRKFIKEMEDGYYYYEFDENTITNVQKKKGDQFVVDTNELFTFIDDDGKMYEYDRNKKYHIEKVDDSYQITKIEYKDTKKDKVN